jgi:hypothetical protein
MPTVKLRGRKRPVVRAHGLRKAVKAAKGVSALDGSGGSASADLGLRLREAGELVADLARANASWSERIPGSVRVGGGRSGVVVRAGNRSAPHAYSWEIPGVQHPVFGGRDTKRPDAPWVPNGTRRFMLPAADEGADGAAEIVAQVISDWAREYGFTE